ncbi:MAG: phosphonopyruvate decarboxylase [Pseudomonadota bacterium]
MTASADAHPTFEDWQNALYDQLRAADISIFSHVPDAGFRVLIERAVADTDALSVPLTTEAEGVGLSAGAHLGGKRAVLMMQSSGVGNCINQFALIQHGAFPFLGIVSMRGEYGEANPWQYAMGQAVGPTLSAMGIQCLWANTTDDVEPAATAAISTAFAAGRGVALILSQRLLGAKAF